MRAREMPLTLHVTRSLPFSKYIESPDVEKEVKRLLSTDADAVSVRILLSVYKYSVHPSSETTCKVCFSHM